VFFDIAFDIAQRSKDDSTQVGAVLVGEGNRILSTGFNGPPPQLDDNEIPWDKRPDKYAYIIHADENAMLFALEAHGGKPLIGSTMFLTAMPCTECVLRMIRLGIGCVAVPSCHKPYVLSKYQVPINDLIAIQCHRKLRIEVLPYERP
jgi:dCMP deaminase